MLFLPFHGNFVGSFSYHIWHSSFYGPFLHSGICQLCNYTRMDWDTLHITECCCWVCHVCRDSYLIDSKLSRETLSSYHYDSTALIFFVWSWRGRRSVSISLSHYIFYTSQRVCFTRSVRKYDSISNIRLLCLHANVTASTVLLLFWYWPILLLLYLAIVSSWLAMVDSSCCGISCNGYTWWISLCKEWTTRYSSLYQAN